MTKRGVLLVLSAPTGAGKTTIARRIEESEPNVGFSVSHTTRPPRPGERGGVDYHFVVRERFEEMVDAGDFVEWAEVHGRLYGTHAGEIKRVLDAGSDLILDIDVQGGLQIREAFPDSTLVFIVPPSLDVLLHRLTARGGEVDFDLVARMRSALKELDFSRDYDYTILNDGLEEAVASMRGILHAARQSRDRQADRVGKLHREVEAWLRRHDV